MMISSLIIVLLLLFSIFYLIMNKTVKRERFLQQYTTIVLLKCMYRTVSLFRHLKHMV